MKYILFLIAFSACLFAKAQDPVTGSSMLVQLIEQVRLTTKGLEETTKLAKTSLDMQKAMNTIQDVQKKYDDLRRMIKPFVEFYEVVSDIESEMRGFGDAQRSLVNKVKKGNYIEAMKAGKSRLEAYQKFVEGHGKMIDRMLSEFPFFSSKITTKELGLTPAERMNVGNVVSQYPDRLLQTMRLQQMYQEKAEKLKRDLEELQQSHDAVDKLLKRITSTYSKSL